MKPLFFFSLFACNKQGTTPANSEIASTEPQTSKNTPIEKPAEQPEEANKAEDNHVWVQDVGLSTPESVLYDKKNDRYLVSNINGKPTDADDNGFISILTPDGKVDTLKWIDGASDDVQLSAPKGMAILDNTLYVTDINTVRLFDIDSGLPSGNIELKGSTFLNDAVSSGSEIYISDSGMNPDFSPSGTDAIYRIYKEGKYEKVVADPSFSKPNGLATRGSDIYMVNFGGAELRVLNAKGETMQTHTLPKGSLDGIELRIDGSALISSWESNSVYLRKMDGTVETVVSDVDAPADIGWDLKRNRVLVPLFKQNKVLIQPLGPHNAK
ncbi:MAG: hypothetical protein VX278_00845 [Myxococcota bacterium]|nr:hypothetical protein [Myxococcota bacterium]